MDLLLFEVLEAASLDATPWPQSIAQYIAGDVCLTLSGLTNLERGGTANTQHGLAVGACRLERGGRQGERSRRSSPCAPPNFNFNAEDVSLIHSGTLNHDIYVYVHKYLGQAYFPVSVGAEK